MNALFLETTVLLGLASMLAVGFRLLKQPPILAYILTGILLGPFALVDHAGQEAIHLFSEIGITLLLFMLGLELKLSELRFVGKVALLTGLGQIIFSIGLGVGVGLLLGYSTLVSLYIGIALAFSSTIIIVKLLSDKHELGTLHGKVAVGILLLQDFVAILTLILLTGLSAESISAETQAINVLLTILKAVALTGVVVFASKLIFPKLTHYLAKTPEILFVFTLAWAFGVAALVSADFIGLSIEIGGFLAGLALANSVESFQIVTKIKPLRDFFIILFFINLGMGLELSNFVTVLPQALLISAVVIISKPFIVIWLMGRQGYRKKTSFLAGISLGQISEFSLIVLFMALRVGHIDGEVVALMTMVAIITFTVSTYGILHSRQIYKFIHPRLSVFEKTGKKFNNQDKEEVEFRDHVVVVGANRVGMSILDKIKTSEQPTVVVDYDPSIYDNYTADELHFIMGDIADPETQSEANIHQAELVVSTIPSLEDNMILVSNLRQRSKKTKIIVTVHRDYYAPILYKAGADHVIFPYSHVGNNLGNIIRRKGYDRLEQLNSQLDPE